MNILTIGKPMSHTIRDLAHLTNLSITTVSRALDGYDDVSNSTRERVLKAAKEIGYEPSAAARNLRRKKSDAIGYILPTSFPQFSDPYYSAFLAGLCDTTAVSPFDLVISSAAPNSDEEKNIYHRWISGKKVDGIILNRIRVDDWRIDTLLQENIPFVPFGHVDSGSNYTRVRVNDHECFFNLTNHLLANGHVDIAYIGADADLKLQRERLSGFQEAMDQSNYQVQPEYIITGDLSKESGIRAAHELLSLPHPPTAIMCCNDMIATGVYKGVTQRGLRVGHDIAVTGYGGFQEGNFVDPPLTTAIQPTYEIACKMANILFSLLHHENTDSLEVIFESDLVYRSSSTFQLHKEKA